jgi:hypothetical protein
MAPPPRAVTDSAPEAVVVDLRLGKLAATTVQAFRVGDEVLMPLGAFFDLAEIGHGPVVNGRLVATLQPGDRPFVADARGGTVSAGETHISLGPRGLSADAAEVYLSATALAKLLDVGLRVDWAELSVTADEPATLPLVRRLMRLRERELRLRVNADGEGPQTPDESRPLSRPLLDGAVLDYAISMPTAQPLRDGGYALQFGADLFGGALQSDVSGLRGLTGIGVHSVTSWTGVWRDSPVAKQARIGSTITTGPGPQAITGATITNAPFVRAAAYGVLQFPGQVGPHWEVEVYRDGLLIGIDSTDAEGRFRVPVAVRYGSNLVRFVGYGPHGEVRDFTGSFLLVDNLIPAHHFEYAASAGRCTGTVCQTAANLDFRYGLSNLWTLRAGLDGYSRDVAAAAANPDTATTAQLDSAQRVRDTATVLAAIPIVPLTGERLSRAYASISGNPIGALNVTVGLTQRTSTNLAFQYQPSSYLTVIGSRTAYVTPITDALLGLDGVTAEDRISGYWRPFGEARSLFLDASEVVRHSTATTQTTVRSTMSVERWDVRFSPFLARESYSGAGALPSVQGYGIAAFVPPLPMLGRFLGSFSLRPSIESHGGQGIDQASLGFARSVGGTRLDGTLTQSRVGGAAVSLSVTADLARFRTGTNVSVSSSSKGASQFVQGSVLFDRSTGSASFSRGPSLGRSGVHGRVFLDANGNGRMDPGEEPLRNVSVRVGSLGVQTDSSGRFHVWDVPSFEPVLVSLDTSTFAVPIWTPTVATISVQPGPHRFESVDFPVVVGGTVDGRVQRVATDGTKLPVPGATVLFRDLRTGASRSIDTFSDGSFTATGIRPGRYELRIEPATLAALKGRADPLTLTVGTSTDGATVSGVELTVRSDVAVAVQPGRGTP